MPRKKMSRKKKMYTEEDLSDCLHAIRRNNKISLDQAASMYNIPPSTVRDRLSGRTKPYTKPGPSKLLTKTEEDSLANYARYMAEIGLGITTFILSSFALAILRERDPRRKLAPKKNWARKFMKRHHLSFRKASMLSKQRIANCSVEVVDKYFVKLAGKLFPTEHFVY